MVTGEKIGGDNSGKTGWEDMEDWKGSGGVADEDNSPEPVEESDAEAASADGEPETVADEKKSWVRKAEELNRRVMKGETVEEVMRGERESMDANTAGMIQWALEAEEVNRKAAALVEKLYKEIAQFQANLEQPDTEDTEVRNEQLQISDESSSTDDAEARRVEQEAEREAEMVEMQNKQLRLKDELMAVDAEIRRAQQEAEETKEQAQHDYEQAEIAADGGDGETAYSYLRAYRNGAGEYERKARLFEDAVKNRDEYATRVRELLGDIGFSNFMKRQQGLEAEASAMRRDAEREVDESDEKTARLSQKMLARRMSDNTRKMFDI